MVAQVMLSFICRGSKLMPYIISSVSATLKNRPVNNDQLAPTEKFLIPKGTKLGVKFPLNDSEEAIQKIELTGDYKKIGAKTKAQYYIYAGEWQLNGKLLWIKKPLKVLTGNETPTLKNFGILLKVPFFPQTDNLNQPDRTCNTSSCAMVGKALGTNLFQGDDDYWGVVTRYGDTTDHSAQTKALADMGIKSTWHINLGFDDLDSSLEAGYPVVIGILHRGTIDHPTGGHMIVVIGRTLDGDYVINDPYGSLLDYAEAYSGAVTNGKQVVYPRWLLRRRWLPEGEKSGWGRLFYQNRKASFISNPV
jgi:hypothetical protein